MALPAEPLVGRADELASLDQVLSELDRGRAGAIELAGEAGIGKTRLLRELTHRAEARGHLVLSGSAAELEQDLPFSVFVDALDEYVRGLGPARLAALDDDVRAELGHVFPSLAVLARGPAATPQHERYRSHRAIRLLLEQLATTKPLVLVLDDFHWADAASAELLGALLRRPPADAVLIALALRPRQMPERLAPALERAERARALMRVELGPLTQAEARDFLGAAVDRADVAALYGESGGNPFYLEQLARSLEYAGTAATGVADASHAIGVPSAVAAALTEELALLSDEARLVLEGAAVAGDPFEPELAAAASAKPESAAMHAVDQLLQCDLVRTTDVPRRFRFRHPLVRRAIYQAAPAGWRLGAHERCAEALAERGATAAARAHHVERSAREGDLAAVEVLREAGETAARLAPASAARWFAATLRLLPQNALAQERVELLLAQAEALTATAHFAESHTALVEGIAIVPADSLVLRTRLIRTCAAVEQLLGHPEQAHDRLENALRELPESASPEAVGLMIELAQNGFYRTDYQSMLDWAEPAVEAANRVDDPPLTAAAAAMLALADALTGSGERFEADLSEAATLVDSLSDDELAQRLDAAALLAGAELYLDRFAEADAHASRALALGRATGQGELFLVLYQILGRAWYVRGKLTEATELLDGAIEASRLLGNTYALAWNLFNRSVVALAVGELDLALATAQESVELSSSLDEGFVKAWAGVRLAAVLLETGQPVGAVDLLLGSAGGEELALIPGGWRAYCLELLTRCWLALDRHAEAKRAAARAAATAEAVQLSLPAAWADRALAAVAIHAGDPAHAAELALASAAAAEEAGAPIEAALSRTLAGRALAQESQRDRAVAELQRAAAELDSCGALRYRDQAEHELGKLGHRVHRRTRPGKADATGLETLTARELQVAQLVADSKTNPEIASELFLSQKTVETHIRNIFRKLDIASRVELARAVERADHSLRAPAQ
jgi:ATP/maltotriose-dependent transcriptional regulator MalT